MHGVEYVRWRTVNHYLREFGFSQDVAKQAGAGNHARFAVLVSVQSGARSYGYRYHLKIKQEYFYSGS